MTDLSHIYSALHENRFEHVLRARRERDLQTEVYALRAEVAARDAILKTELAKLKETIVADTFQEYLERAENNGVIDFSLRIGCWRRVVSQDGLAVAWFGRRK